MNVEKNTWSLNLTHLGKRRMDITVLSKSFNAPLSRICVTESKEMCERPSESPSMQNCKTVSQNESITPITERKGQCHHANDKGQKDRRRFFAHVTSECPDAFDVTEWSSESEKILFGEMRREAIDIYIRRPLRSSRNRFSRRYCG